MVKRIIINTVLLLFFVQNVTAQWGISLVSLQCVDQFTSTSEGAINQDNVCLQVGEQCITNKYAIKEKEIIAFENERNLKIDVGDVENGQLTVKLVEYYGNIPGISLGSSIINLNKVPVLNKVIEFTTQWSKYILTLNITGGKPKFPSQDQIGYICWHDNANRKLKSSKVKIMEVGYGEVKVQFLESTLTLQGFYYEGQTKWMSKEDVKEKGCN